jgi:hypothetical protein
LSYSGYSWLLLLFDNLVLVSGLAFNFLLK